MFCTFPFPIFLICIFSLFPSHTTKICPIFSLYSSISSFVISFFGSFISSMFSLNQHSCFIFYMVLFKSMHYSNIFVFPLMIPALLHYFTYFFALIPSSCVNALPLGQSDAQSFFHPLSIALLQCIDLITYSSCFSLASSGPPNSLHHIRFLVYYFPYLFHKQSIVPSSLILCLQI